ncbi:hypothetical protein [Synechococcus elongatus]|uniref:hypothetical protein n=1 Tax=Synechococcus elongatus TaxID=32046 RepID=UPI0013752D09|nr:hypothetical protein [Synechococcus elongatus]
MTIELVEYLGALLAILIAAEYVIKLLPIKPNSYVDFIDEAIGGLRAVINYLKATGK